jgi:iron complex transport system ATP-binding protein
MCADSSESPKSLDNVIKLTDVSYYRILPNGTRLSILKKIDWNVKKGERWILFGPNGAGKTTLLNIIMGILFPSSGTAEVLGERIGHTDIWELQKRVTWVSSSIESRIHDEDPLIEIVLSGIQSATRLFFKPNSQQIDKAIQLMKMLNLEHRQETSWGLLSEGEKRKALIARALIIDPQLLILDEPCEGLDLGSREKFLKDLNKLMDSNRDLAVIMITHRVEEILDDFKYILVIKQGEVLKSGPINQILNETLLNTLFGIPIHFEEKNKRYVCFLDF